MEKQESKDIPKEIIKEDFEYDISVPAIRVLRDECSAISKDKRLVPFLFKQKKIKPIYNCPQDPLYRIICLDPTAEQNSELSSVLSALPHSPVLTSHTIHVEYAQLSSDQILSKLLPPNTEIPSSFETIGHIAHLNLREDLLPYKHLIGQVLLDKNQGLKTVINKLQMNEKFRFLEFELLAGLPLYSAQVKENKIHLQIDVDKVYWNSRLVQERERLLMALKPQDVLFDVMAGVGAFAIQAALQGLQVYANDLNPECHRLINLNARKNHCLAEGGEKKRGTRAETQGKETRAEETRGDETRAETQGEETRAEETRTEEVPEGRVRGYCVDGREFIRRVFGRGIAPKLMKKWESGERDFAVHFVMNLPEIALEFLDAFKGLFWEILEAYREEFHEKGESFDVPVKIHCHCFSRDREVTDGRDRIERALGFIPEDLQWIHVRDVAPHKIMFAATFTLDSKIGFFASNKRPCSL